jgi:hypothetical protein
MNRVPPMPENIQNEFVYISFFSNKAILPVIGLLQAVHRLAKSSP